MLCLNSNKDLLRHLSVRGTKVMVALSFETSSTSHLIGRGKGVKMEAKKNEEERKEKLCVCRCVCVQVNMFAGMCAGKFVQARA